MTHWRMPAHRLALIAAVLIAAGCASTPPVVPGIEGKPIAEFFDDVKTQLREVHWRVRSDRAACGTTDRREVDLRNASITLDLQRIDEANVDGAVKLVAIPLGTTVVSPVGSATAARKWSQQIVLKLDVAGPSRLYDAAEAPPATARSRGASTQRSTASSARARTSPVSGWAPSSSRSSSTSGGRRVADSRLSFPRPSSASMRPGATSIRWH